jgi:prevent-host-death family protein
MKSLIISRKRDTGMGKIKILDLEQISATKAKIIFGDLLHQTSVEGKKFVVDRHGKPVSVIISYREYLDLLKKSQRKP